MAGIMDKIKDSLNDGAILTLGTVAVIAGLGAANQAGFYNKLPGGLKIPGVGSSNDDWWAAGGQGQGDGEWQGFGEEYEEYGGSYNRGGSRSTGGSRAPSAYNKFVGQRIPQLTAQGHTPKQAMKTAAKEWGSRSSGW